MRQFIRSILTPLQFFAFNKSGTSFMSIKKITGLRPLPKHITASLEFAIDTLAIKDTVDCMIYFPVMIYFLKTTKRRKLQAT